MQASRCSQTLYIGIPYNGNVDSSVELNIELYVNLHWSSTVALMLQDIPQSPSHNKTTQKKSNSDVEQQGLLTSNRSVAIEPTPAETELTTTCSHCREIIKRGASKCPHCNEHLNFRNPNLRRFNSIFPIVTTIVTLLLLWGQNSLIRNDIRDQAKRASEDTRLLTEQIELQRESFELTQRAVLLETIFGRRICNQVNIENCPFLSSARVRSGAVVTFIAVEKSRTKAAYKESGRESQFRIDLNGVDLSETDLSHVDLSEVIFSEAVLNGVTLIETDLEKADLQGAKLSYANLEKAKLCNANLVQATLRNTNLKGASLHGAKLQGIDLEGAQYDHFTIWPENFDPGKYGAILIQN